MKTPTHSNRLKYQTWEVRNKYYVCIKGFDDAETIADCGCSEFASQIVSEHNQFEALNAVAIAADAVYKGSFSQDDKRKLIEALSNLQTLRSKQQ